MVKAFVQFVLLLLCSVASAQISTWQWAKQGGSTSLDAMGNLCTDANGDVYVIGSFGFSNPATSYIIFDNDTVFNDGVNQIFLVKYSGNGAILWAKSIGGYNPNNGVSSMYERGGQVFYDASTNSILITGNFSGGYNFGATTLFGIDDLFLAKLDLNGNFIWAKGIYSTGNSNLNTSAISTDVTGNIYLSGSNSDSAQFDQFAIPPGGFLAKYDSNGNILWAKKKFIDSYLYKIKIYNNEIFTLGKATNFTAQIDTANYTSTLSSNMFFACFDTLGTIKWIKYPTSTGTVGGNDMDMDASGNFYISGGFHDNVNFDGTILSTSGNADMFIIKYDSNGNIIWIKQSNSTNATYGTQTATTSDGSTYVAGIFTGNATFGTFSINSVLNNDHYIARYNSNGDCLGVRQLTGISYLSLKIAVDNSGNCFAAGEFSSQINIGSTTLTPIYAVDVFIAKHDVITGIEGEVDISDNQLIIYANPNAGKCSITVPDDFLHEKNLILSVFDNSGKLIQKKELDMNEDKIKLNLESEAKGIYNVILSNGSKSYSGKIILN